MENERGDIVTEETIMKGHQEAKAKYVPQSPQYTPSSENEEEDMSSDEDIEAPCLAPKNASTTLLNEDLRAGYNTVTKEDQPTRPPTSESSGEKSVPDLIDLQEEHQPPPVPQPLWDLTRGRACQSPHPCCPQHLKASWESLQLWFSLFLLSKYQKRR